MLRLRPFTPDDEAAARAAHAELLDDGFTFLLEEFDESERWSTYLDRLADRRRGIDVPAGRVPSTFLAADVGGQLVGRVSIRHELNDFLLRLGGHIGYGVRPGFRRRGYATAILRESLAVARELGLTRVLVTCDDDNTGSATVIERCGGALEDVVDDGDQPRKRRYWITLD